MSTREARTTNRYLHGYGPRWASVVAYLVLAWSISPLQAQEADSADPAGIELFEKRIRPVLVERCYECHSSKAKALEGNLSLETRAGMLQGGDSGPAIVPGEPDKSRLILAISYQDESLQMPPKERLPAHIVADFVAWIKRGAPDPRTSQGVATSGVESVEIARRRWPFAPLVEPPIPAVKDSTWSRTDIDRFVLARLEERGLRPVADAGPRALIRRVTYDLIGLPPTPEEIDAFLADRSPAAFENVVERLLNSPHYGERWGRHWLDVVRYADTAGDNSDYPIPQMHLYRNWVIDAFNRDLPYDQFIREQLAGDLLGGETDDQRRQRIIATGYIANARRFGSRVDDYPQHLTIEDTIDNLGKAFLGLSLNCARCHNHKFDPISTDDYYALYGILHSTRYPWPGIELDKRQRDLVPLVPASQVATAQEERKRRLDQLSAAVQQAEEAKSAADTAVKELARQLDEARKAPGATPESIKELETRLAESKANAAGAEKAVQAARKAHQDLQNSPLPIEHAYAVGEGKKMENVKVHLKGDPERLGEEIPRGFPKVLGGQRLPDNEPGSGRRQLADWIADPANPLTARVMVNRIWQYHFGRGLVPTPNDFGKQGKPPSHPELLDYLAVRFIASGWSIKAMHRLMLTSRTYQLASQDDLAALNVDPAAELFWRYNRRRLDAESIRDTLLDLGGNLDRTPGGEHPFPPQKDWNFTQHVPFKAVYETNRRSVYLMTQRIQRHPFLGIFDGPDTSASTASRGTSTTTLQALYFLNDPFVHDQAARFAARLRAARSDDADRIELAYLMAFGRPPSGEERQASLEFLARAKQALQPAKSSADEEAALAWNSLVRALLRTNEFVYLN